MFCALLAKISGEHLQDHWSSVFLHPLHIFFCADFFKSLMVFYPERVVG